MSAKPNEKEDENDKYYTFENHICPDGYPYMFFEDDDGREPGFFFDVSGIPEEQEKNAHLRFRFEKLSN